MIEKYWGKGIATETAKSCLKYAFEALNLNEVYGICDVGNVGSKQVLEKCGFTLKETFMHDDISHYWFKIAKGLAKTTLEKANYSFIPSDREHT